VLKTAFSKAVGGVIGFGFMCATSSNIVFHIFISDAFLITRFTRGIVNLILKLFKSTRAI
jgi:hypothetical protein